MCKIWIQKVSRIFVKIILNNINIIVYVTLRGMYKTSILKTFLIYLIRINFRADKFSRIFAQKLNLREIARKLVPNFEVFRRCAKIYPRENFLTPYFEKV